MRRILHQTFKHFTETKRVLQKILYRLESRRILENIAAESISDIQLLFTMESPINPTTNPLRMDAFFLPLNFTNIAGRPHAIPEKAIGKLPTF